MDRNNGAPFTPLPKPLIRCTVALVTSAGLHLRDDKPFRKFDPSYRVIPADAHLNELVVSHTSIGFDRVPMQQDLNVVFPLDRIRELVPRGAAGAIGPRCYSFMGAQRDLSVVKEQTGPEVAKRLVGEGVEVVVLTPT
ncbi:glycine/sarcosine/betaine reductase selenoprotein B family protein [Modestobacter sp. DSM 44400]|uniref:glycine/sarcosine/betaine reductase selenoprotein B family protein n=1 Tax=Modestobacter sp. DSM 44400 TaxID=1550230 RepID=UPI001587AA79|nr:glycine/sarcosine/betaine reductase selenoprotein B family protein [Modestobacter sp. DSM 44400]